MKELRETSISLRLVKQADSLPDPDGLVSAMQECEELIAIFVKSILTAQGNRKQPRG